jgi:hypothetical protein
MILAYIKLRKRNLGPILDANGWAVNAKAKINVPFGTSMTEIAKLPLGATRDLVDPFAEKKSQSPKIIALLLAVYTVYKILWIGGYVFDWTGGRYGLSKPKLTIVQPASLGASLLTVTTNTSLPGSVGPTTGAVSK